MTYIARHYRPAGEMRMGAREVRESPGLAHGQSPVVFRLLERTGDRR
jgi:hypothetical protein